VKLDGKVGGESGRGCCSAGSSGALARASGAPPVPREDKVRG